MFFAKFINNKSEYTHQIIKHDIAVRALVKDFDWLDDAQAEIAALKGNWPKWLTGQVFSLYVLFSNFSKLQIMRQ